MNKKAVIIGSGMAGLTAAILLSARDWDVTVLEQHHRAGGLMQQFHRGRWTFDTGFHYCGGVGKDHALGRILRHLGVFDELTFKPLSVDGYDRLIYPGLTFDVPVGVEPYRERLRSTFPHESAGIDSFVQAMLDAVQVYGMYQGRAKSDFRQVARVEGISLWDEVAKHVTDPMLIAVLCGQGFLYGVQATHAPFGLHALVMHHFLQGATRLKGGGQALVDAMVDKIRAQGGTVRLQARVQKILAKDRVATGVELATGEHLEASFVVSSMHPRALIACLPPGSVRPAYVRRVHDQIIGPAGMGVYLSMDGPCEELAERNIYRWFGTDVHNLFRGATPTELTHYVALGGTVGRPLAGKPGGHALLMTFLLDYETYKPWADGRPHRRGDDYKACKRAVRDLAVQRLLEDLPSLRGRVVRTEASTGLTIEHYTGSPNGAMYGHYHCVDQMGRYRPSQATRVRGLLQVGQSVFAPGVLGAALSSYYGVGGLVGLETLVAEMGAA